MGDLRPRISTTPVLGASGPFNHNLKGWNVRPHMDKLSELDDRSDRMFGAVTACVSTFIGVVFFTVMLGLMIPVFSDTCVIADDGTCSAGCGCVSVDTAKTPAGTYREYSPINVFILAVAVGGLRFLSAMIMGRWSSSSMDWFNEIALGLKNWLVGDHYVYWKVFVAQSVAYILGSLAATGILVGMNDGISDLGLAQLTRHGSGANVYKSHISLTLIAFFGTLFFVWSRYKYMYQGADAYLSKKGGKVTAAGDGIGIKYMPLWPKLGHHYGEAAMNGVTWFGLALATGMFVGPSPLFFWQTFWTGIFDSFNGGNYHDPETHYLMFLLYPLLRLAAPLFMYGYLWFAGITRLHKYTDKVNK